MPTCPNFSDQEVKKDFNSILTKLGGKELGATDLAELHSDFDGYVAKLTKQQNDALMASYNYWDRFNGNTEEINQYVATLFKVGKTDEVEALGKLRKAIGLTKTKDLSNREFAGAAKKLGAYNKANGTAHEFVYNMGRESGLYYITGIKERYQSVNPLQKLKRELATTSADDIDALQEKQQKIDDMMNNGQLSLFSSNDNIKRGVNFAFEQNPSLATIGTKQQYSLYLDTIFPNSKVKNVLLHGSPNKFSNFEFKPLNTAFSELKGVWFTGSMQNAKLAGGGSNTGTVQYIYPVVLDIRNPIYRNSDGRPLTINPDKYTEFGKYDSAIFEPTAPKNITDLNSERITMHLNQVVVFKPEQIHTLGSQKDIDGFRQFVSNNSHNSTNNELNDFLATFLTAHGIQIEAWDKIKQINGQNVEASYNTLKRLIGYAKGHEQAFPEEAAHAIMDILSADNTAIKELNTILNSLNDEQLAELFGSREEFETYTALYNGNMEMVRTELAGKLLTDALINRWQLKKSAKIESSVYSKIINALKQIWNKVKTLLSKVDLTESDAIYNKIYSGVNELADDVIDSNMTAYKFYTNPKRIEREYAKRMGVTMSKEESQRRMAELHITSKQTKLSEEDAKAKNLLKKYSDKYKILKQKLGRLMEYPDDNLNQITLLEAQVDKLEKLMESSRDGASFELMFDVATDELNEIDAILTLNKDLLIDRYTLYDMVQTMKVLKDFPGLADKLQTLSTKIYPHIVNNAVSAVDEYITKGAFNQENDLQITAELLEQSKEDIDTVIAGNTHTGQSSNYVMQAISILIKSAREAAIVETDEDFKEIEEQVKKLKAFQKKRGISERKMYDDIVEERNGTYMLISPYTKEFMEKNSKSWQTYRESQDVTKKSEAWQWLFKNTDMHGNPKIQQEFNATTGKMETTNAHEKFFNDKYNKMQKTPELKEFYEYFQNKLRDKRSTKLPLAYKNSDYFIPNLRVQTLGDAIKHSNKPWFGKLWDGLLSKIAREVTIDANGHYIVQDYEKDDILGMRMMKNLEAHEKSKDLGQILYEFSNFANIKYQVDNVMPEIRTLEYYMKGSNSNPKKYSSSKGKVAWEDTNLKWRMDVDIRTKLMGEGRKPWKWSTIKIKTGKKEEDGTQVIKTLSMSDLMDFMMKWNSRVRIGYKPITALNNALYGQAVNSIIAAGGLDFNGKEFRRAQGIFFSPTHGILNKNSKFRKIMEQIKPMQELEDYSKVEDIKINRNVASKGLKKFIEYGYIMQKVGEKWIQYVATVAAMMHKTAEDANGNKISWWDMFDDEGNFKSEQMGYKFDTDVQLEMRRHLQEMNAMYQGRYAQADAAAWTQYTMFRMALQFRKWLPTWIELHFATQKYNPHLGRFTEGRVRTMFRMMGKKEIDGLQVSGFNIFFDFIKTAKLFGKINLQPGEKYQGKYQEYEAYELANARMQARELFFMMSTMLFYILVAVGYFKGDDDKKKKYQGWMALMMNQMFKLGGDMTDTYKPTTWIGYIANPFSVARLYWDVFGAMTALANWATGGDDKYKTGKRKGESKTLNKVGGITPGVGIFKQPIDIYNEFYPPETGRSR